MTKFKIGDKVKIAEDSPYKIAEEHEEFLEEEGVVLNSLGNEMTEVEFQNGIVAIVSECLELISSVKQEKTESLLKKTESLLKITFKGVEVTREELNQLVKEAKELTFYDMDN